MARLYGVSNFHVDAGCHAPVKQSADLEPVSVVLAVAHLKRILRILARAGCCSKAMFGEMPQRIRHHGVARCMEAVIVNRLQRCRCADKSGEDGILYVRSGGKSDCHVRQDPYSF